MARPALHRCRLRQRSGHAHPLAGVPRLLPGSRRRSRRSRGVHQRVVAARPRGISRSTRIDVWSEPHMVNWVWFNTPVEFCYCPHTQARFREWLKPKYRTARGAERARGTAPSRRGTRSRPRGSGRSCPTPISSTGRRSLRRSCRKISRLKADASAPRGARPVIEPLRRPRYHAQPAVRLRQSRTTGG